MRPARGNITYSHCLGRHSMDPGHRRIVCLLLALNVVAAFGAIPLPQINTNNIVSILNYGAVGDGVTTNTSAIQNAINVATSGGATNGLSGGTVEIPAGVYLSGPLSMKSYLNLHIDAGATLQMLPYGSFPATSDFISAANTHDIEISGTGTIDGQGAIWWATNNATPGGITRPKAMFAPSACTTVLVRDVNLQNPPNTHISFRNVCVNVTVDHVDINTPNGTPNTDGIDCSAANVLIENSHITDGDDHIAMGDGHAGSFSHDITITNCLLGTGHGISIGSYTHGGLSNLLVVNCVWTNGSVGIKVKSDIDRGGVIQSLRYLNLAMTNTQIPIYFYTYYTNSGTSSGVPFGKAASYPVYSVSSNTPIYRDITVSNLTAVAASGFSASIIWGRPELAISNVVLDHVTINASKYFNVYNARGVQVVDSQITTATGTNYGLFNADLIITNRSPSTNRVFVDGISTNGYGNSLSFFNSQASLSDTNALDDGPLTLAGSTFTVSNNLSMTPTAVFNYTLGTNAATVAVRNALQIGGSINVFSGSGFTNGTYTLMTYNGALSGTFPAVGSAPPAYIYSFNTNITGKVNLIVNSVPAPPASLTAQGTNLLVLLQWPASAGATGYNLQRSATNGGPYAGLATLTATNFSDTSVSPGMVYYYVVSSTNSAGESTPSVQASATPLPSLTSTNLNAQTVGNQVQLSWPADHLGWRLQVQTNAGGGFGTNWVAVPNSTRVNQTNVLVDPANGSVFYRLVYP